MSEIEAGSVVLWEYGGRAQCGLVEGNARDGVHLYVRPLEPRSTRLAKPANDVLVILTPLELKRTLKRAAREALARLDPQPPASA